MNGKDIELSNKIDKFIKEFEKNNPNIKAHIASDNSMNFNVDFEFNVEEQEQQKELEIIKKAYLNYFGKELKKKNLLRIGNKQYSNERNFYYIYEI